MASLRWIVLAVILLVPMAMAEEDDTHEKIRQKHQEHKQTCGKIVRATKDKMERYLRGEYPGEHGTACFIRCVAILGGWYDDETGINLEPFYEVYGKGSMTMDEYREESKRCFENLEPDRPGHCWRAYRPVLCLKHNYRDREAATPKSLM